MPLHKQNRTNKESTTLEQQQIVKLITRQNWNIDKLFTLNG